ncbi:glycosyltransferase involved in cell wall biosynthesis [Okibacterium sp. HSC-33S16]|uniref:glycosyltransferase n=1 Tax=Okibacterium sp. HSC-33S16 TaxID=2910965 RepID=UPI0020A064B7|nr:glycosyltransferase [Okibacterium sp. HSC-33S16]MCP2032061.1 glycosyltransferase involved in cell wall biosynthesis [Okibacterium sp. HSC-33S16]
MSDPHDVVFTFSYETWTDAVARGMMRPPDRLLSRLLESPAVNKLLVANPFRWLPSYALRTLSRSRTRFPGSPTRVLHTPLRLHRADRANVSAVVRDYRAYDRSLERASERLGQSGPVVISANPIIAGFAPFDWAGGVTFYARDDWLSSPARQEYWHAYREAYRRIADRGVGVVAVSEQVLDRISPTGPSAVVPNGVEPAEWAGPVPTEPAWLAAIPGPRALYVGTLDSRLDVEGLAALARRRPDLSIILLGPQPEPGYLAAIRGIRSVYVHPSVGREELVAVMRNVDVCLLAHRTTPLTEAMSPLKVYEYLAAGCPVLAIDLPPVRRISERVLLTATVADFTDRLDEALALGPATEVDRLRFVADNSWESRHRTILGTAWASAGLSFPSFAQPPFPAAEPRGSR